MRPPFPLSLCFLRKRAAHRGVRSRHARARRQGILHERLVSGYGDTRQCLANGRGQSYLYPCPRQPRGRGAARKSEERSPWSASPCCYKKIAINHRAASRSTQLVPSHTNLAGPASAHWFFKSPAPCELSC